MTKHKESLTGYVSQMKQLNKELENTSDSLGKSLANTLNSAGDKLSQITNMLNIQSLTNNQANSELQKRYKARASVMSTMSMTSNSQFDSFRKSLQTELQSMNKSMDNIFNADDMYEYMNNLSTYRN